MGEIFNSLCVSVGNPKVSAILVAIFHLQIVAFARHKGKGCIMCGHGISYTKGAKGLFSLLTEDIVKFANHVQQIESIYAQTKATETATTENGKVCVHAALGNNDRRRLACDDNN